MLINILIYLSISISISTSVLVLLCSMKFNVAIAVKLGKIRFENTSFACCLLFRTAQGKKYPVALAKWRMKGIFSSAPRSKIMLTDQGKIRNNQKQKLKRFCLGLALEVVHSIGKRQYKYYILATYLAENRVQWVMSYSSSYLRILHNWSNRFRLLQVVRLGLGLAQAIISPSRTCIKIFKKLSHEF